METDNEAVFSFLTINRPPLSVDDKNNKKMEYCRMSNIDKIDYCRWLHRENKAQEYCIIIIGYGNSRVTKDMIGYCGLLYVIRLSAQRGRTAIRYTFYSKNYTVISRFRSITVSMFAAVSSIQPSPCILIRNLTDWWVSGPLSAKK